MKTFLVVYRQDADARQRGLVGPFAPHSVQYEIPEQDHATVEQIRAVFTRDHAIQGYHIAEVYEVRPLRVPYTLMWLVIAAVALLGALQTSAAATGEHTLSGTLWTIALLCVAFNALWRSIRRAP